MKKLLKSLVLATLVVGTVNAADDATNKTFINSRSHGTNLEVWYGAGMQEIINRKDKNKFGGTFFATGFYNDGEMAGEYWAPQGTNNFLLIKEIYAAVDAPDFVLATDKASLDPEQTAYGVTLAYDHRLDKILKGLYFSVQLPIVHVENDLGFKLETATAEEKTMLTSFYAGKDVNDDKKHYMKQAGFHSVEALKYAQINGEDETTGIADIDMTLGYNFINKPCYHVGLNLGITIPTGKDSEAIVLNEAIVGNGQHFGLGGGLTYDARIWGNAKHNFIVYGDLQYKYLLEASGKRTLGIKEWTYALYNPFVTSHGAGDLLADMDVVPGANVLTQNVNITPGSQFEGIVALAYNNGGFGANLGYNLYYRETEDVKLKDKNALESAQYWWISEIAGTNGYLEAFAPANLDLSVAETPSQISHKVFGGLAWTFKKLKTPVNVGVGGHYEFMDDKEGYENWGLNARMGIGF